MVTGSLKALRKVQLGKEATKGTAVPATEILLADADLTLGYELYRNPHPFGVLVEHAGPTALLKKDVDVRLRADGVTFEQLPWFLSLCLDQPATTGVGPYEHLWNPGTAALWDPHSATLEARYDDGAAQEDIEVEYLTGRTLRISGDQNGQLQVEVDAFGRQVTDAAITSLSLPATLTPITVAMGKIYINNTFALADLLAPAAGIISNQIISFNLEIDVGQFPWHGIEGNTFFAEAKERAKNLRFSLRALVNPDAASEGSAAERVHAAAEDLRFMTLAFTGPGNLDCHIVFTAKHEMGDFLTITEQDGMDVIEMTMVGHYDPTGAVLVKVELNNDDADPL